MHYKELSRVLDLAYEIRCAEEMNAPVPIIWGPPGCGKTQKIDQWIASKGPDFKKWSVLGSTLSPTDVACYVPDMDARKLVAFFSERLPDARDNPDATGVIFADEFANTHPEVQKSFAKLINEGRLDGLVIPRNVMWVLASNRTTDRAGANQLLSALSTRLDHHDYKVDPEEVADHFIEKDYNELLISYFYHAPDQVHIFDPSQRCWPNPRTWEFLAMKMKYAKEPLGQTDIGGVIGEAAGAQFWSYMQTANLIHSKDDILKDPEGISLPEKMNHEWQQIAMLSMSVKEKEFELISRYIRRFQQNRQVLFIKLLRKRKDVISAIEKLTTYKKWVTEKGMYDLVIQNI